MAGNTFLVDDGFDFGIIINWIIRKESKISADSKGQAKDGYE
jgi:hypothetical protein